MADGWTELGAGLAGGWGDGRQAFVDQLKRHGDAGQSLAKARIERSRAMAHEGITPEAVQAILGGGDDQFAGLASVLGASASPDLRRLGEYQRPGYAALEAERQEAMRSGNFKRMNAATAVLGDKQYEQYAVEGAGKLVFDPVTGEAVPTALGESAMGVDAAQAAQAAAAAGASTTRADAYAGTQQARQADIYSNAEVDRIALDLMANDPELTRKQAEAAALGIQQGALGGGEFTVRADGVPVKAPIDVSGFSGSATTVPLGSDGVAAREPAGGVATVPGGADPVLAQAKQAIAKGAPREAVIARLREMGRDDVAGSL